MSRSTGRSPLWWVKKRWRCAESLCRRATFTEHTDQVPPYARLTTRLKERIVTALAGEVRCVDAVASELGVSWPTAMRQLTSAMAAQAADGRCPPGAGALVSGIDEHRFRTVRWYKDDADGSWRRMEPWMTTFINLATGQVIGVVDGRDSGRGEDLAEDPTPVGVDHFHLVKLANDMVTTVRRRVSWDRHDRRGRGSDMTWANRLLLMRGYESLSARGQAKLKSVLDSDDPTCEIGAAWGVKEQLRRLLATTNVADAQRERATFNRYVTLAAMPETTRLKKTIDAWWPAIATFIPEFGQTSAQPGHGGWRSGRPRGRRVAVPQR
jgi:transposase